MAARTLAGAKYKKEKSRVLQRTRQNPDRGARVGKREAERERERGKEGNRVEL